MWRRRRANTLCRRTAISWFCSRKIHSQLSWITFGQRWRLCHLQVTIVGLSHDKFLVSYWTAPVWYKGITLSVAAGNDGLCVYITGHTRRFVAWWFGNLLHIICWDTPHTTNTGIWTNWQVIAILYENHLSQKYPFPLKALHKATPVPQFHSHIVLYLCSEAMSTPSVLNAAHVTISFYPWSIFHREAPVAASHTRRVLYSPQTLHYSYRFYGVFWLYLKSGPFILLLSCIASWTYPLCIAGCFI